MIPCVLKWILHQKSHFHPTTRIPNSSCTLRDYEIDVRPLRTLKADTVLSDLKINFEQFRESLSSALKSEQDYRSAVQKCSNPKWLPLSFQKNFHLMRQLWKYYLFGTPISYFSNYIFRSARTSCTTFGWSRPVRPSALKIWITYIQAYMPYESSGDSSNQPDGPMGSPRRLP